MVALRLPLFLLVFAGCSGPKPGPPPPAPAEAGVDEHYERAFAALRTHPAVQAFAAEHLAPSEALAISVAEDLVPLNYSLVAADVARSESRVPSAERMAAVQDSLATLAAADRFAPFTDGALSLLSLRQQRPLVLFFGEMRDGRLPAQLYPNPYRRSGFASISDGAPGLALLVVFDGGRVATVYSGPIAPD